jgi:hypothetical protein
MADFPYICPVRRTFKAAKFPTKRFNSITGAGTTRLYGNKAFDATLQMEFVADDEAVEAIIQNWHDSMGNYLPVVLPETAYAGQSELLQAVTPDYLEWHWEKEPTVTSVQPNLSRVQVNLIAHLEI